MAEKILTVNFVSNIDELMKKVDKLQKSSPIKIRVDVSKDIDKYLSNVDKVNNSVKANNLIWKDTFRTIEGIGKHFKSWNALFGGGLRLIAMGGMGAAILAGVGALTAILGSTIFKGFVNIANVVTGTRLRAYGLGMPYNTYTSFQTIGGLFMQNPEAALGNLATARSDVTSTQRRAFSALFGMGASAELGVNKSSGEVMFDFLEAARTKLQGYRPEVRGTMAETMGLTSVVSMEDLRTWMELTVEERKQRREQVEELKKATFLSREQQKAWVDLTGQVRIAGATIWTTFVKQITPFTPAITNLTKAFTNAVTAFLKTPLISEAINYVAAQLNRFAGWLASDESQSAVRKFFTEDLPNWFKELEDIFAEVKYVIGTVYSFLGGPSLDKDPKTGKTLLPKTEPFDFKKFFGDAWKFIFPDAKADEVKEQKDSTKDLTKSLDDLSDTIKNLLGFGGTRSGKGAWIGGGYGAAGRVSGPGRTPSGPYIKAGAGLTTAVSKDMTPEERAMLDVMAYGESGKASYKSGDPDYGAAFQGNRYQFLGTTWRNTAREIGADPNDRSPENQDRVALALIKKLAGGDLSRFFKDPASIRSHFASTWHALYRLDTADIFRKALEREKGDGAGTTATADGVKKAAGTGARFHIIDPTGVHTYPAPTEHVYGQPLHSSGAVAPRPRPHPLDMSRWQAPDRGPNVAIHNKTGSDVFINASTLATV